MSTILCPLEFYNYLISKDITFFTGVPDSLLKEFNNVVLKKSDKKNHVITANEGASIALATGYHFSTRKVPLVYLQNSGTGNIINPLMSLVSKHVYAVPMLIVIGWRGEPGVKDEPQHVTQGACMEELLKSLGMPYDILPTSLEDVKNVVDSALNTIKSTSSPYVLLVKKNTFNTFNETVSLNPTDYTYFRKDAVECLISHFKEDVILCTTGKSSRELLESADNLGISQDNIFLNVGAMGHVSMISQGIASHTSKRVLCIDGDGSCIMHMGNLSTIGSIKSENLFHVVLNNGMHESVGIQPTCGFEVDFVKIAQGCGYTYAARATSQAEINRCLEEIRYYDIKGPYFIEVRISNQVNYTHELSRPKNKPIDRKEKFMNFIS
jgi:phosphonopyruvate decarboxylase